MSEEIKIEDMVGVIGAYCIFASYYASKNDKEKIKFWIDAFKKYKTITESRILYLENEIKRRDEENGIQNT